MVGIKAEELLNQVIRPTLKKIGLYSESAANLLLGTAAQESNLGYYLKQTRGPALGIYQCEPSTHDDIIDNYLKYRVELLESILTALGLSDIPTPERLITDLAYATVIARVHYLRVSESLPPEDDIKAQACYWKQYYNTYQGKGSSDEYQANYYRYILGVNWHKFDKKGL